MKNPCYSKCPGGGAHGHIGGGGQVWADDTGCLARIKTLAKKAISGFENRGVEVSFDEKEDAGKVRASSSWQFEEKRTLAGFSSDKGYWGGEKRSWWELDKTRAQQTEVFGPKPGHSGRWIVCRAAAADFMRFFQFHDGALRFVKGRVAEDGSNGPFSFLWPGERDACPRGGGGFGPR